MKLDIAQFGCHTFGFEFDKTRKVVILVQG